MSLSTRRTWVQSIAFYEKNRRQRIQARRRADACRRKESWRSWSSAASCWELIEPPVGSLVPSGEGSIPHFAVYVDDLDKTAADLKAAGIISFTEPEKRSCRTPSAVSRTGSSPARPASRSNCSRCSELSRELSRNHGFADNCVLTARGAAEHGRRKVLCRNFSLSQGQKNRGACPRFFGNLRKQILFYAEPRGRLTDWAKQQAGKQNNAPAF